MRASRGMGAINTSKMPGKKIIHRKDDPNRVELYKKGGMIDKLAKQEMDSTRIGKKEGGPVGLYANINKRKAKGISRSKSKSTITPEAYANMKAGFPKRKK